MTVVTSGVWLGAWPGAAHASVTCVGESVGPVSACVTLEQSRGPDRWDNYNRVHADVSTDQGTASARLDQLPSQDYPARAEQPDTFFAADTSTSASGVWVWQDEGTEGTGAGAYVTPVAGAGAGSLHADGQCLLYAWASTYFPPSFLPVFLPCAPGVEVPNLPWIPDLGLS